MKNSAAKCINPQGYRELYSRRICIMDVRIPPGPDARKSTDHQREQSVYRKTCRSLLEDTRRKHPGESQRWRYRETCRGDVEYRISRFLHSTVQKEDTNRATTEERSRNDKSWKMSLNREGIQGPTHQRPDFR